MQRGIELKDDVRSRFRAYLNLARIGGIPGTFPPPNSEPARSSPMPAARGSHLARNIILAAERSNVGDQTQNLPLASRQPFFSSRSFQPLSVQQGSPRGRPMPAVPPIGPSASTVPPRQRSLFDIAGRFHDFQAGPKIARPNLAEEFIPVVGPAWDAVADLQDGHYGSAAFNAAMAVGDALPLGWSIKAGRGALKLAREMGTLTPKAASIQRKMHKIGLALRTDDVHHVFELNGLGRYVPNWKNNPIFLKVLPRATHQRLHRSWGGEPKFGLMPRLWHGTTDWMKAGAAGLGSYTADGTENLAIRD